MVGWGGGAGGRYEADNKRQKWRTGQGRVGERVLAGGLLGLANLVGGVVLLVRSQKMIISTEINFPTLMVQVQSFGPPCRQVATLPWAPAGRPPPGWAMLEDEDDQCCQLHSVNH